MGFFNKGKAPLLKPKDRKALSTSSETKPGGRVKTARRKEFLVSRKEGNAERLVGLRSTEKLTALQRCELVIEECIEKMSAPFRELSDAVAKVLNERLYKQAGYHSFEDWCLERYQWGARYGYRLAQADSVMKALPESANYVVRNESQAHALASVPKRQRVAVIKRALKDGPLTAKRIVEASRPPSADVIDAEIVVKRQPCSRCVECPDCNGKGWIES